VDLQIVQYFGRLVPDSEVLVGPVERFDCLIVVDLGSTGGFGWLAMVDLDTVLVRLVVGFDWLIVVDMGSTVDFGPLMIVDLQTVAGSAG
jgi:hypothetical protein